VLAEEEAVGAEARLDAALSRTFVPSPHSVYVLSGIKTPEDVPEIVQIDALRDVMCWAKNKLRPLMDECCIE
jgi:hypothetical protein